MEEKENKKKFWNTIFWIVILGNLIACSYIVYLLSNETTQCISNAFVYGAKEQVEGDVMCSCTAQQEEITTRFMFNESDWWSEPIENPNYIQITP